RTRGHLHGARRPQADSGAEQGTDNQHCPPDRGHGALVDQQDQRRDHRDDHAGGGHLVAAPGGRGGVHQVQADHEAGGREDVDQLDVGGEGGHDRTASCCCAGTASCCCAGTASCCCAGTAGWALRRNIFSIRPVTT